ncbi:Bacteriodes thetaiotaomicron symbiotic chitinase [Emericellopsis cladophorae]|uniref:Bacteriodes thetaiotaomicron symbiotic chitinase n=1 Tax=Emericellopsis cladophorae TaxID=2686198 RepID=A0A9Q0BBD6_9HYPO|nr:Bacteriodes thetaiotaomicron symbiotic chitinase [Emericellopsis cladophorae]KAI6779197.1 Bacteriodes thetaiotaomicron symbiotic chitinase [Emericellopsis cladophorae]
MWNPSPAGYLRAGTPVGQLHPQGPLTSTPAVGNEDFWRNVWNNENGLPAGLPPVTETSPDLRRPVDRLFEALGSNSNPTNFLLLDENVNELKGLVETFKAPMAQDEFDDRLEAATNPSSGVTNMEDVTRMLAPLRELSAMFTYLGDDDVISAIDNSASAVYLQLQLIELWIQDAEGLSAHWSEFYPEYFRLVSEFARTWARDRIEEIRTAYEAYPYAEYREEVLAALTELEDGIPDWKYPSED